MVASVCRDICWRYRWWTGAADTTSLYGTLTQDLKLKPGSYTGAHRHDRGPAGEAAHYPPALSCLL
jgi:hypothetical protein